MSNESRETNNILVVDDEESLRHALTRHLRRCGYVCDAVATGFEGIERFAAGRYAAVLTDVRLPDLGGLDVLAAVLEMSPHTPVVVMTGYGTLDTALEAMRRGAVDFLEKPFSLERVAAVLDGAIRRRGDVEARRLLRARVERGFAPERYENVAAALGRIRPSTREASRPGLHDAVRSFEVGYLQDLLERTSGNVTEAAKIAGLTRTNLHKKIRARRLDLARFRRNPSQRS